MRHRLDRGFRNGAKEKMRSISFDQVCSKQSPELVESNVDESIGIVNQLQPEKNELKECR